MSAPLSASMQAAHAVLLGHANEVRALAHVANFETRIDDVGFEWIETMLLHARSTFEKYCLTESNPPSDDITLGTQAAAITLASEMLKTPSRRRANAALFPGGAAAASRRRAAPAASSDSADKENAPVVLAAVESASSSSGSTGLGIGARSTRSRADKSEMVKMPNPFAAKKSAPEKSSSDKDVPLSDKPAKAPKKALKDAAVPQPVASSSSSADAGPSSAEEPPAPAKKTKKGTKASAAAAAKAAAKAARAEEAAAEPKPTKRKTAKGKAAAASDVESTKPAPAAASSKAPTPPAASAASMPRAASQFFDVDDDNSHDLDATMAHESEAVRASTPLPAGAKKVVPTTRSREESLELIAPSHVSDSDDDDDAQELVSAREKLSETSGSPVLAAEEPAAAKLPVAEKPAAKPTPAEPLVAAPKRTLGDYGTSKKNAPAAAAAAASAATAASSSSTSSSSTHNSSTPAAPAFRSSFLNKSLRKAVTSAQEADEEADSESDESDKPPLRAGKRAAKAATSANTRANATAASSRTRAAAKRKSDEMEAPSEVEEAAAPIARPQKSAKLAASMQSSDPPRTLGTAAAPSTAAAPPTTTQSGFDAIRSRLENVRRISGAHRGNAAAALPSSSSAAGSTHVGLGASLASSIFAARAPGAVTAAAPAPALTAAAAAPTAVVAAGIRVRDSDEAAEWQDSTGEPSLESANDDFVAAIKAKAEQFQAEVAASKAAPALPAKDDVKAAASAPAAATSTKAAPAPAPTGSTTPVHSPTAAAPAALPPMSALLNAANDECAVATDSESEGEAGTDEVVLQPRAAPAARRADDEMTLDELVAGSAKAAPAASDKGKAAAAARPAPAASVSASVGPSSAYAAQQARNNLGATSGSTAARPLASMPKVSVNLTGKSAAVNKSLHRSQQAPSAAQAQQQQQRRDEAAREKQREETAHAAVQATDSAAAHAAAPAPGRGGWGILDKAKGFLGFNGGMPSSASGFMPTRPGAAASGSKVPVAPSSPGKSPRKNSTAGPGGNLAASTASQGKPASLARAEAARRREAEEAERRRREKDERRTAAQAEKDAKSKADAEREAERRKRAREPEANRLPLARVPEMAQSKNKAPVSIAVGKSQVRKDDNEAGGKKRRVSDDGASVPGEGASALARSTAAAPPPAGTAAFKPARPGAPSTTTTSATARPPQQLQASASGIPRGAGFASQQYQQQHAQQQQLQQAQAARAAQQASAAAAAAAAASIQRPGAPRPMPPAASAGSSSSAAARPAPPVVAREATPEIVLSDPNSEYSDSDASDVEERRAKERPWEREELQAALLAQATRDPDAIFGIPHGSVPAHEWFANHGSRREMEQTQQRLNRPRSSSGTWTRGDALGQAEIDRYNVQMGIVPAGIRLPRSSARPSPRAPPRPSTLALDAAAQARASQQQGPSRGAAAPGSSRP